MLLFAGGISSVCRLRCLFLIVTTFGWGRNKTGGGKTSTVQFLCWQSLYNNRRVISKELLFRQNDKVNFKKYFCPPSELITKPFGIGTTNRSLSLSILKKQISFVLIDT